MKEEVKGLTTQSWPCTWQPIGIVKSITYSSADYPQHWHSANFPKGEKNKNKPDVDFVALMKIENLSNVIGWKTFDEQCFTTIVSFQQDVIGLRF